MTCKTQPEALRLADQLYSRAKNEAARRNSAYDMFGMDNTPENTHPLETAAAAELRRLHAQAVQDEALLRQALDALNSGRLDIQLRTAIALRNRLEDKK